MNSKIKNRIGQRFGRLVVTSYSDMTTGGAAWNCDCDCGARNVRVRGCSLVTGATRSCGCLSRESKRTRRKHGLLAGRRRPPPVYNTWAGIIQRCHNSKERAFPNYGGRGIRVCERWRHSFAAFLQDVGQRPSPKHTFDRIDNDGDYEPGNCRWATKEEQDNNKRNNHFIEWQGERRTLSQWCRKLGMNPKTLSNRIRRGWPIERAMCRSARRGTRTKRQQKAACSAVCYAVKKGVLPPIKTRTCSLCGKPAVSYHHHKGYAPKNYLEVVPICQQCHRWAE